MARTNCLDCSWWVDGAHLTAETVARLVGAHRGKHSAKHEATLQGAYRAAHILANHDLDDEGQDPPTWRKRMDQ